MARNGRPAGRSATGAAADERRRLETGRGSRGRALRGGDGRGAPAVGGARAGARRLDEEKGRRRSLRPRPRARHGRPAPRHRRKGGSVTPPAGCRADPRPAISSASESPGEADDASDQLRLRESSTVGRGGRDLASGSDGSGGRIRPRAASARGAATSTGGSPRPDRHPRGGGAAPAGVSLRLNAGPGHRRARIFVVEDDGARGLPVRGRRDALALRDSEACRERARDSP